MIACNFNNIDPILIQLRDYCLSFLVTGMCNIQRDQISVVCSPVEASYFELARCPEIELVQPSVWDGNHIYYTYKGIDIVFYIVQTVT